MAHHAATHATSTNGRPITSCSECYRRKQKCNRRRPCNFCSARGVRERCVYNDDRGHSVKGSVSQRQRHIKPTTNGPEGIKSPAAYTAPKGFLDQVGYSTASRREQFEYVEESISSLATSDTSSAGLDDSNDGHAYLSLFDRLPTKKATDALIQTFFSAESWSFPVLDENQFHALYRQFESQISNTRASASSIHLVPTLSSFPALLFCVIAVALQFLDLDTEAACTMDIRNISDCDKASRWYLDTGQDIIDRLRHQKPTTTTIQYYLTKMSWLKTCGRGSEAWQSLGIALRQAQELDLHCIENDVTQNPGVGIAETILKMWDLEHRKRLWARIFVMDSHMAIALGRPRGIHREDSSSPLPLDCDYPSDPSRTVPMNTNHKREPPNAFSPVLFSVALGNKYHDLMSMRASKADLKDHSRIQTLHDEVLSLLTELPPALRPSFPDMTWDSQLPQLPAIRQRLRTSANIFLLALHRSYMQTHIASRHGAVEAAFEILQAQQCLFAAVPAARYKLYGYSFYTVDASIFLTATVLKYLIFDIEVSSKALHEVQQASIRLGQMKERSVIARSGEVILRRCCAMLEASMPSPTSISSWDESLATSGEMMPRDIDNDFWEQFSSNVHDEATHVLMAMLADPATLATSTDSAPSFRGHQIA